MPRGVPKTPRAPKKPADQVAESVALVDDVPTEQLDDLGDLPDEAPKLAEVAQRERKFVRQPEPGDAVSYLGAAGILLADGRVRMGSHSVLVRSPNGVVTATEDTDHTRRLRAVAKANKEL